MKRPVRLSLEREATCRQGIASPQCLDDVCPMAALCRREMHPDIGRNAQVQVVLCAPATGVWDNNTGHETGPGDTALAVYRLRDRHRHRSNPCRASMLEPNRLSCCRAARRTILL